MEREELKKLAGEEAVKYIKDGMIVGLGTGSTVEYTLRKLGKKVKDGLNIQGIPTSIHTKRIANDENIPLTTLEENPEIDLTIDGADEVDSYLILLRVVVELLLVKRLLHLTQKKLLL